MPAAVPGSTPSRNLASGTPHASLDAGRHPEVKAMRRILALVAALSLSETPAFAATVFTQPPSGGLLAFQSSQLGYDRYGSDYDQYIWDDFTLPATTPITEVSWRGVYKY